jgi:KDO2-lipid IV(A) lauroyltransferase
LSKLVDASDAAYVLHSFVPLNWMCSAARWHGRLNYLSQSERRRAVRQNLASVPGITSSPAEIDSLTRRLFEYKRVRGLLLAITPRLTADELAKLLPIEGLEHLDEALRRRQGVILLGSHLNSVVLFLAVVTLRQRGYDVRVAMPEPGEPWAPTKVGRKLDRLFNTKRLNELMSAFYAQFNIRPIVRSLAENAIVAQTGDGLHSARFVEVEFLGRSLPFPTGMASIAQATGAVVVPIFQVGAPPSELRIVIEEPWTVERTGNADEALRQKVAAYAKRLEHHLLQNVPCWEHWLIPDTLATIAAWPQKSLKERYEV